MGPHQKMPRVRCATPNLLENARARGAFTARAVEPIAGRGTPARAPAARSAARTAPPTAAPAACAARAEPQRIAAQQPERFAQQPERCASAG